MSKRALFINLTSRFRSGVSLLPLALLFLASWSFGQASAPEQKPAVPSQTASKTSDASSTPTVITNVNEVTLDLVVRNKKNKPVLDLKPSDLNVTDNGTAVKLSDLRLVTGNSTSDHMLTFLYDQLNSSSATNARNISEKIVKMFPDQGFYFSVLNFGRRLRLYQDFTTNRDDLKKAIYSATEVPVPGSKEDLAALPEKNLLSIAASGADSSGAMVSQADRERAQVMLQSLKESQEIVPDHNVLASLTGLLALSRTERRLHGRKAIVYFVQGYDVKSNAMDTIRSIVAAADRSGVSIYVIDVNAVNQQVDQGLMSQMVMGSMNSSINQGQQVTMPRGFGASNTGGAPAGVGGPLAGPGASLGGSLSNAPTAPASGMGADTAGMAQAERFQFQDARYASPMAQMAMGTGGIAILAGENPKKSLQQMLEDMTTYYEASYPPPNEDYDGKFRPIRVGSSSRKDLRIQTRSGYFAVAPGESSYIRAFEAPLLKILSGPSLPTDLNFRAEILRMGDLPDGNSNTLAVEVPVSDLEMLEDHNTNLYSLHLSVVGQIKNKDGVVIDHFSQDFPQRGALDTKDEVRGGVLTMQKHFVAVPGEYTMEVAVLDQNSGKAAAQRTNFEIQNPPAGPALSDLAIVRQTVPYNTDADPLEPLHYDKNRIVPNLSGNIARDQKNISLFFIIHSDSQITESPVLEMQVSRNNVPIGKMPLPLRNFTAGATVPYMASIQAGSLSAGHYDVTALLSQGEKTSTQTISFNIPGAEVATVTAPNGLNNSNDPELAAYSKFSAPEVDSKVPHLQIAPATNLSASLSAEEAAAMITRATKHSLSYSKSLPNFTCVQITDRSVDTSGAGQWKHRDSLAELLRSVDGREDRTTLAINGQKSNLSRDALDPNAAISHGEFGGMLGLIFKPESKTEFQWKETDTLNGAPVQVFNYRVDRKNSDFSLGGDNYQRATVGFHGLVYLDASTLGVRRITLQSDDVPQKFSIHSSSISIDYDYVSINAHDYLMPMSETMSITRGKHQTDMNEMEFRDYKRYGAKTKISYGNTVKQ